MLYGYYEALLHDKVGYHLQLQSWVTFKYYDLVQFQILHIVI